MAANLNIRLTACIAAAVAGLMLATATEAFSADLGGNCCADLEATAGRKGNRKVSLTISGYVAHEITWWDDGGESNVYLHGLGPTQASYFKLNGQTPISPGWTAGYILRIQNLDDNPFGRDTATGNAINQNSDNFSQGLNVQMSYWYIQSKELGKLSIGKQAHAAKSAAMFTDQSGTQVLDNTPAFAGFTVSASWGEDDFWEVALGYSGEFSGFKLLAGAGYSEFSDEGTTGPSVSPVKNSDVFQVGGYIQHLATGLFLHAAYGMEENNDTILNNRMTALDSDHWYLKGGIRQKWTTLGATVVYGDYAEYNDQLGRVRL